jgi:hypothetical protein
MTAKLPQGEVSQYKAPKHKVSLNPSQLPLRATRKQRDPVAQDEL